MLYADRLGRGMRPGLFSMCCMYCEWRVEEREELWICSSSAMTKSLASPALLTTRVASWACTNPEVELVVAAVAPHALLLDKHEFVVSSQIQVGNSDVATAS